MLPFQLRIILVIGTLLALWVVCAKVKKSTILIEDTVFWMVAAVILVALAVFPEIAVKISHCLGFLSPANFIYLVIIALLLWKTFTSSTEISQLKARVNELAQEIALAHHHDGDSKSASQQSNEKKSTQR